MGRGELPHHGREQLISDWRSSPPLQGERPASPKAPTMPVVTGVFAKLTDPAQYTGSHRPWLDGDATEVYEAPSPAAPQKNANLLRAEVYETPSSPSPHNAVRPKSILRNAAAAEGRGSPLGMTVNGVDVQVRSLRLSPSGRRTRSPHVLPEPEPAPEPVMAAKLSPRLSPQRVIWTGRDVPVALESTPPNMSPPLGASPAQMVVARRKQHQLLNHAYTHMQTHRTRLAIQIWRDWRDTILLVRGQAEQALARLMNRLLASAWQSWSSVYIGAVHRRAELLEQCSHRIAALLSVCALEGWRVVVAEQKDQRTQLLKAAVRTMRHRHLRAALTSWRGCAHQAVETQKKATICAKRMIWWQFSRVFNAWWALKIQSDEKRRKSLLNLERSKHLREVVESYRMSVASRQLRETFDLWVVHVRNAQSLRLVLSRLVNVKISSAWSSWIDWFAQSMIKKAKIRLCLRVMEHHLTGKALRRWRYWSSKSKSSRLMLQRATAQMRLSTLSASWRQWKSHVEQLIQQVQLLEMALGCMRSTLVGSAWRQWKSHVAQLIQQAQLLEMALGCMRFTLVGSAWRQWKSHVAQLIQQAQLLRMALECMRSALVGSAFHVWSRATKERARLREMGQRVVHLIRNRLLARALKAWHEVWCGAVRLRCLREGAVLRLCELQLASAWSQWVHSCHGIGARREKIVLQVVASISNRVLTRALNTWVDYIIETTRVKSVSRHVQERLRALVLSLAWSQWNAMVDNCCRQRELAGAAIRHLCSQVLSAALRGWRNLASRVIRHRDLLKTAHQRMSQRVLCRAMLQWRNSVDDVEVDDVAGPDTSRLMIYSSDTPDIDDFSSMLRCQKARYDFETAGADTLKQLIANAVATNNFRRLKSIAIACHGPQPDADGVASAAGATRRFHWAITRTVVVQDDIELLNKVHPARQVVDALGNAVQNGSGRVDLLACSLLQSREGREVFETIERETRCNFAASENLTSNPRDGGDWVMESDNIDIRSLYFLSTAEFDGTFATQASNQRKLAVAQVTQRHEILFAKAVARMRAVCMSWAWVQWSSTVDKRAAERSKILKALRHRGCVSARSAISGWHDVATEKVRLRLLLERAIARMLNAWTSGAFCAWVECAMRSKRFGSIIAYSIIRLNAKAQYATITQWASVVQILRRQRQMLDLAARRRRRNQKSAALASWQYSTRLAIRHRNLLHHASWRLEDNLVARSLDIWIDFAGNSKRLQAITTVVVARLKSRLLSIAWEHWTHFLVQQHSEGIQKLLNIAVSPIASLTHTRKMQLMSCDSQLSAKQQLQRQRLRAAEEMQRASGSRAHSRRSSLSRPLFMDSIGSNFSPVLSGGGTTGQRRNSMDVELGIRQVPVPPARARIWMVGVPVLAFLVCLLVPDAADLEQDSSELRSALDGDRKGSAVDAAVATAQDVLSFAILLPSLLYLGWSCCFAGSEVGTSQSLPSYSP